MPATALGLLALIALGGSAPAQAKKVSTLYVSPDGNDLLNGTSPGKAMRTPQRAIQAVLGMGGTHKVVFLPGVYRLTEPIEIKGANLDLILEGKEGAILTGLQEVKGTWDSKRVFSAEINPSPEAINFTEIFVDGERRLRPRLPKNDYFHIDKRLDPLPENSGKGSDGYVFQPGSFRKDWYDLDAIEVYNWLEWSIVRAQIKELDMDRRQVRFKQPTGINDMWARYREGYRYFLENVREAQTEGEFYADRKEGRLTYIGLRSENNRAKVEIPVLEKLLVITSDLGKARTSQVTVKGLTFEGTKFAVRGPQRFMYQAEADLTGALQIERSKEITVDDCTFRQTGGHAIRLTQGVENSTVSNCVMSDLGGGGIYLGEMERFEDDRRSGNCVIADNAMIGLGRLHPAAVGIWVGQNPNNVIRGNWIEDGYYTGISVGWSWGYGPSGSRDNVIENNTMSRLGHRVMSDMGGIYTLSPSPGTVIRGNRINDVQGYSYGGWGIYPDEGSSEMLIEKNVVWNTRSEGFHVHYGKNNTVRNNVFAYGLETQVRRSRGEDHLSFTFSNNIVEFKSGQLFGLEYQGKTGDNVQFKKNLYWQPGGAPFKLGPFSWEEWRSKGQDEGTILADPEFRNPKIGDFRPRNSKALKAIEFEMFERLGPEKRPDKLPKSVPNTFPIPKEFKPAVWG